MRLGNGFQGLAAQRRRDVARVVLLALVAGLFLLGCYGVDLWLSRFLAYP
jgi:hypothetical protein